jgi:hypothetical protein
VISIGTAIVSYIEPHPGQARAFNEWYERDHFPAAVLAGPGVFSGKRYVATHACKTARPASSTLLGDPQRGSYLAVAWLEPGAQPHWDAWVVTAMERITAEGRLFAGREHVHTAVYRFVDENGLRPAITALAAEHPGVIVASSAVAVDATTQVTLALERTIVSSANPPAHELVIAFCNDDPMRAFVSAPTEGLAYASPFLATIPGTDTYTEDL